MKGTGKIRQCWYNTQRKLQYKSGQLVTHGQIPRDWPLFILKYIWPGAGQNYIWHNKWGLRVSTDEIYQPNMFLLLFLTDKVQFSLTGHVENWETRNQQEKSSWCSFQFPLWMKWLSGSCSFNYWPVLFSVWHKFPLVILSSWSQQQNGWLTKKQIKKKH